MAVGSPVVFGRKQVMTEPIDGHSSRLRNGLKLRGVGLMAERWAIAALESEVVADDVVMEYWRDKMGIDLGVLKASYGWVFPKGDHLSVGVGGRNDRAAVLQDDDDEHGNRNSE